MMMLTEKYEDGEDYYFCSHPEAKAVAKMFPRKGKEKVLGRIEKYRKGECVPRINRSPCWCPLKLERCPKEVNHLQAYEIINKGVPHGLFWAKESDGYVGIYNMASDETLVEEFEALKPCLEWLVNSNKNHGEVA